MSEEFILMILIFFSTGSCCSSNFYIRQLRLCGIFVYSLPFSSPAAHIFLAWVMIIFLTQSTFLSSSHYLMSLRTIFTWLIKSHSFLANPCAPSTKKWNRAGQSDFPLGPSTISHWTNTEHIQAYTIFPPPDLPPTFDKIILAKWNVKR